MKKTIDSRTGRPLGDHGTHADALDFVNEGRTQGETDQFIADWQVGDLSEWPEFYPWLAKREEIFDRVRGPGWRYPERTAARRGFAHGLAVGVTALYLLTGLFLGLAMQRHIPAMNAVGVAYYAATWPAFVSAASFGTPAPTVPGWAFTFKDR